MKCCAETGVDGQARAEMFSETRYELWAAIRDDGTRQAMEAEDLSDKERCQFFRIHCCRARDQMTLLGEAVNHHPDSIEPIGQGKTSHEIHGYILPRAVRY